ncbi:MAG: hypothetical protein JWO94_2645 [Verrucomicrobiaceae bacterium]|nr:hypothetical protein [Verrucomicrobiaceae bacterium]
MKILIDECIPGPLGSCLTGHDIHTVQAMGWGGQKDSRLLALASTQFDAFLTGDKNLRFQQNLEDCKMAIVLLPTTHWPTLRKHVIMIQQALDGVRAHAFIEVSLE